MNAVKEEAFTVSFGKAFHSIIVLGIKRYHARFCAIIVKYNSLSSGKSRTQSIWLGSSVDRALHRYRKVMGSNPLQA